MHDKQNLNSLTFRIKKWKYHYQCCALSVNRTHWNLVSKLYPMISLDRLVNFLVVVTQCHTLLLGKLSNFSLC